MDTTETAALLRLMDSLGVAVLTMDDDDRTILWNETFLRFFPEHAGRVHQGESYRQNLRRFYDSRLSEDEAGWIEEYIDDGTERHRSPTRRFEFSHQGRRLRAASIQLPSAAWVRAWIEVGSMRDSAARPGEVPGSRMLDNIADGIVILDEHNIIEAANEGFRLLYEVPPTRDIIGSTVTAIIDELWAKTVETSPADALPMIHHLRYAGYPFEIQLPGERWARVMTHRSDDGRAWSSHSDITHFKRRERDLRLAAAEARTGAQQLRHAHAEMKTLASTDMLTGLPNRRSFDAAFAAAWLAGGPVAVMVVDLDHFKRINDRFGHPLGDECLKEIGRLLPTCLRSAVDVVARFGGEEFCVLLPGATGVHALTVADAVRNRMSLTDWSQIHPDLPRVTCSIGICIAESGNGLERADVLRVADEMLYRAKANGRDRVEITVRLSPRALGPDRTAV